MSSTSSVFNKLSGSVMQETMVSGCMVGSRRIESTPFSCLALDFFFFEIFLLPIASGYQKNGYTIRINIRAQERSIVSVNV